jgi:septal ring factor EnvC (AmiA/AmiB activator)
LAAYDKKLAKLENDRLESATSKDCECTAQVKEVTSVVDKHSDNVSKLEKEYNDTNEWIGKIDENLKELENKKS